MCFGKECCFFVVKVFNFALSVIGFALEAPQLLMLLGTLITKWPKTPLAPAVVVEFWALDAGLILMEELIYNRGQLPV